MEHTMNLQPKYFGMMVNENWLQRKTVEFRLYDEKRRKISLGDDLKFINTETKQEAIVSVKGLVIDKNFENLISEVPVDWWFGVIHNVFPRGKDVVGRDKIEKEIKAIYTDQDIKKYGVIAIKFKLLKVKVHGDKGN